MEACIAFLIDADNLNDPEAVAEAFERLHALVGPSTVRRAYGSADSLKGVGTVLNQYAVRPCANFMLEKNTTDLSLAVDAMELACESRPTVLALGSGDADFYPLLVRLRERGVRVIVFSQHSKLADDLRSACVEVHIVGKADAPRAVAKPKAAPKKASAKTVTAKMVTAKKVAAKAAKPVAAPKATSASTSSAAQPKAPTAQRILDAVPGLRTGEPIRLNEATQQLHAAAVMGKSAGSVKVFRKFGGDFELTPSAKPTHVRWTGQRGV